MGIIKKPNKARFVYWQGYLFAVGTVALATWLKYLAQPRIIPADVPILYILAIVLTATFFGLGPSILCCLLSLAAWSYFFLPPTYTFSFNIDVLPISLVFLSVGVIISYLSSSLRKKTEEAKKEAAERKQAEKNVLAERQQFNDVLETLPCYLVLLSPDYHVVFANKFFRERFGESHGRRCFEYLFNRPEPCEVCETYKVLQKMEPLEWEWVGPDGHNYYIYDFPFKATDGSTLIMEVGIDITVQKKALAELSKARDELELRVQERTTELKEVNRLLRAKMVEHRDAREREKRVAEEWQATFDFITDMVSIQDKDCRLIRVNKAYADAVGMSLEELSGEKCYAVIHRAECPVENCPHQETLATHKAVTREIFEPRLGLYLEVSTSPVFNEAGELTGSVHIAKDITERKRADEALRESQHDLNRAQAVAQTGSWRLDIRRNQLSWSDETYQMFGIPMGTPMTYETFLAAVHPDDRQYVDGKWLAALLGAAFDIEHRIIVGGEIKWVHEKAELEFDQHKELQGGFGTVHDITERKKSEQSLIHLNRELRAISECNQAIVRAKDELTLFTDVCHIMCDVVGYRLAWVGAVQHDDAKSVRPVAFYGDDNGYIENLNITWADTNLGRGPTGVAARTGKTDFCQDFATDPKTAPWRDAALARGYRSSIAIPLSDFTGNIFAVFMLYADQSNRFTPAEVGLLEELAGDLSFGIGVLRERAKRQQAEANLRETRDYLDNLFNYANAPIIVWNPEFEITRFNHAFERLTGLTADEVLGKKLDILFPDDSRESSMRLIHKTAVGQRWDVVEIPILHRDGTVYIVLWNSATIYAPDAKTAVATIAQGQDITELKKIDKLKDEFIGLVSHELRTPLTVITGSLRTAMSKGLSAEEVRELLQNATEGADQLASILENMLELSRYQAGHLKLRVEPVSITGTARSVIKKLKEQRVSQQFLMDIPRDLPPVEADPMRVERILYNLLENATKYSPADSQIKVTARPDGNFIVTSVSDQGPGISPDNQARLFEQFQQLETTQRPTSGAGLGLVVCKRLAEAQGGWIKVDSAVGKDSTFSFALPKSETPS